MVECRAGEFFICCFILGYLYNPPIFVLSFKDEPSNFLDSNKKRLVNQYLCGKFPVLKMVEYGGIKSLVKNGA